MNLHVVALPFSDPAIPSCAYARQTRGFAEMTGAKIYSNEEREAFFDNKPGHLPAFDANTPGWRHGNARAIMELREHAQPGDILCLSGGHAQKPIADALPHLTAVEYGVGYSGVFSTRRVFSSYAWQHTIYGALYGADAHPLGAEDTVIPNYFAAKDFPLGPGGDYLLYMGRLSHTKGIDTVLQLAERHRVVVAGAGEWEPWVRDSKAEFVGHVGPAERVALLGGARAVLMPTRYCEPFGNVMAESLLVGTPVLCSDWGSFPEYVRALDGARCRTLADYERSIERVSWLNRSAIRARAVARFDLGAVAPQYAAYFEKLRNPSGASLGTPMATRR